MIPLTTQPDHAQLEAVRPLFEGKRCVVIGSAPLTTRTAQTDPREVVACVNGAISSVAGVPDCWVLNSKPSQAHLHLTMVRQGAGRTVKHIAFLRSPIRATEDESLRRLQKIGCQHASYSVIDKPIKRWFEEAFCDRRDGLGTACSAGMFTVALALWSGATRVRLLGFSWNPGYHYLPKVQTIRGHVEADGRAIRALVARYPGRLAGNLIPREAMAS